VRTRPDHDPLGLDELRQDCGPDSEPVAGLPERRVGVVPGEGTGSDVCDDVAVRTPGARAKGVRGHHGAPAASQSAVAGMCSVPDGHVLETSSEALRAQEQAPVLDDEGS
jgi:hypothetical protein